MKKFISILLIILSVGGFISCSQLSEESNNDDINAKIEKIENDIKEKEIIVEKELDEECDHDYSIINIDIEDYEYTPQLIICTKCGGKKINGYIKKSDKTQSKEDAFKELENIIKKTN